MKEVKAILTTLLLLHSYGSIGCEEVKLSFGEQAQLFSLFSSGHKSNYVEIQNPCEEKLTLLENSKSKTILRKRRPPKIQIEQSNRAFSIIEPGDTLSEVIRSYIGRYYSVGHKRLLNLYQKYNPEISDVTKIYVGQKIYHPDKEEFPEQSSGRELASSDFEPSSEQVDRAQDSNIERSLTIEAGLQFVTIDGENQTNGRRASLINEGDATIGLSLSFRSEENVLRTYFDYRKFTILQNEEEQLVDNKFSTIEFGLEYLKSFGRYIRLGPGFGSGSDYFQYASDSEKLRIVKVKKLKYGLVLNSSWFESDKLSVETNIKYFVQQLDSPDSASLKNGDEQWIDLQFKMPFAGGGVGTKLFYKRSQKSSDIYEQVETIDGASFFYSVDF